MRIFQKDEEDGKAGNSINTTNILVSPDRSGSLLKSLLMKLSATTQLLMCFWVGQLWFAGSHIEARLHSGFLNVVLDAEKK